MPQVYLKKASYDKIIGIGENVGIFVNKAVEQILSQRGVKKQK